MAVERVTQASKAAIKEWLLRIRRYGLEDRCHLILHNKNQEPLDDPAAILIGGSRTSLTEIIATTDVVWCSANTAARTVLERFKRKILLVVDPGHLQVSANQMGTDFGIYDAHWTLGMNVGSHGCGVPILGHTWQSFPPVVHLSSSQTIPPAASACLPITSITHWNWGELD